MIPVVLTSDKRERRSINEEGLGYDSTMNSHQIKKRESRIVNDESSVGINFCDVNQLYAKSTESIQTKRQLDISIGTERLINGGPISLYVEMLVVADQSIYEAHQRILGTNDSNVIFQSMKIYYSHMFNGVLIIKLILLVLNDYDKQIIKYNYNNFR